MTPDGIREFRDKAPFEAFEVVLIDGTIYPVPHRDFIFVPPGRSTWVYIADKTGYVRHVNTAMIKELRSARPKPRGRRKAG